MLLRSALMLCLVTANVTAQATSSRIENQDQLVEALLKVSDSDPSAASMLLNSHKNLVTAQLWQRLIDLTKDNPAKASAIYDLALQVCNELHDKRLIASTYYKIGWYQFGQGNIPLAIQNYQRSKQSFEEAGVRRDLIYILADLGTLCLYSSDYKKAKEYSEESLALAEQLKTSTEPSGAWPDE